MPDGARPARGAHGAETSGARRVVLLAGGVGGAKLADGLHVVLGDALTVVVNTADDVELHGLLVMPDHDTVMYTLAGLANREWGWGLAGETFAASEMLGRYGEPTWFRLGDRDLATHVARTRRLREGQRLTDVCLSLQRALGVAATILPMSDDPVRTEVRTDEGWLDFQEYFVHRHQEPDVREVRFAGVEATAPSPEVVAALEAADVVVIAPSNPIVSIGPILALPGFREARAAARARGVPVVAVSGIVAGRALKGPADRMLASLGHEPTALGVARLYDGLLDAFVLDAADADLESGVEALGVRPVVTDTVMTDDAARARLARRVLEAADVARA
jgi:LPPG:FO 2-phospho-L-lactate transferase